MTHCDSLEVRNLSTTTYEFDVETMVAKIVAKLPGDHLYGLYQIALLDSRGTTGKTRWLGVYSAKDRRRALIELYLEPILAGRSHFLDRAMGFFISELLLAQAIYHQVGVHYAAVHFPRREGWARLFSPSWYAKAMLLRYYNPISLMVHFPARLVRSWQRSVDHTPDVTDTIRPVKRRPLP